MPTKPGRDRTRRAFKNVSVWTQNAGRPANKGHERKQFVVLFRFAYLQHIHPNDPGNTVHKTLRFVNLE